MPASVPWQDRTQCLASLSWVQTVSKGNFGPQGEPESCSFATFLPKGPRPGRWGTEKQNEREDAKTGPARRVRREEAAAAADAAQGFLTKGFSRCGAFSQVWADLLHLPGG